MRRWLSIVVLTSLATIALPQDEPPDPKSPRQWRVRGQFAGHQGLGSVGAGPLLAKGLWRPALMYGFAPADAYRTAVHQVILRNDFVFMQGRGRSRLHVAPAASLNLLMETGRHSYLRLPERFPRGYYMAPLPRATVGVGGRLAQRSLARGPFREWAFTAEAVALDTYLWYAVSERGFPLWNAFGLSFGAELVW